MTLLDEVVSPIGFSGRPDRLHKFFEDSVDRTPGAIAVRDDQDEITYAELDRRANQLTHHLSSRGLGLGSRVGILLMRSASTYVALLGVTKSGATFVPIDPASPADRIAYIVDDSALDLLITSADLAVGLTQLSCDLLALDAAATQIADEPSYRVGTPAAAGAFTSADDPRDLTECYVIYTSGSSGRPKGVAVSQSSICNFISVVTDVYDVRPTDRVYQGMTISFDFSIEEIWPTFAAGATLVVGPNDSRRLGAELADFLDQARVTVFYCVPTLLATISRDLPLIRSLMVGGEACPGGIVERWSRPGRRMLNTYGPTESTVTATWGELHPGHPVTIGRPLPTYSVVILDDQRRRVANGEVGEICVGGPGVALRYLNLPEKTADRFIHHDGERIYRTGDLGRIDRDGDIHYLGRADDEVKIRGHRVDLGEIESLLLDDPEVESAVAAMMAVGEADELVAYVTRQPISQSTADAELVLRLRDHLRDRVPDYMIPGYLDVLPELPTMVSGKVDRRKLPPPSGSRLITTTDEVVTPVGAMEEQVRDAWAATFGLQPGDLSVTADFFDDLGGHSLLAATCVSLLRERGVGVSPAVRDVYSNPTVRALAQRLDDKAQLVPRRTPSSTRLSLQRHSRARYSRAGVVQAGILYLMLLVLTLPVASIYAANHGHISLGVLSTIAVAATVVYLLLRWLVAPLLVRALSSGVVPGRYPLWGSVYLRVWTLDLMLALSPLPVLSGSPLFAAYLRLLGAQVGRNVHVGTSTMSIPTLLRIGDGVSIGYGVAIRPWLVEDGYIVIQSIVIGSNAFVGSGAVLEPGATVNAGAAVGEQSTVANGQRIPGGEQWGGSPSARLDEPDPIVSQLASTPVAWDWTRSQCTAVVAGLGLLEIVPLLALIPSLALVWGVLLSTNVVRGLFAAAFVGPVFVLTVCVLIAVLHKLFLPSTPVGVMPARSSVGIRKWLADKLLEMSLTYTNSLYATLYTVPWLRSLGAQVGRGAEVSTVAHLDPDLLTLGKESFVADMAMVGSATFHQGWVSFRRTDVGARAFVGNAAMLTPGTTMGSDSLIGVATVPPRGGISAGSAWLGSPAMNLPARQHSGDFAEHLTYRPSRWRVAERLGIEFLRITLPASLIAVAVFVYLQSLATMAVQGTPFPAMVLVAPVLAILTAMSVVGAVAILKWLVVGRYRPRVEPLWSRFVRRAEFVTGLYEAAAVPALLYMLVGTPMLPPILRLFGAQVGQRTWIATTYLTEFDLVDIGDDAMIGRDVSLQTHLFEDRVMKMSTVRIGAGAMVGDRGIVLYDATVGQGAALEPLSLVMKGEHLPAQTRWRGIPAEAAA
ncbi:MAG: Pls/PosA family non-ribosomal peptide synthetase [Propionibacteriaceae bacterium]